MLSSQSFLDDDADSGGLSVPLTGWTPPLGFQVVEKMPASLLNMQGKSRIEVQKKYDLVGEELVKLYHRSKEIINGGAETQGWVGIRDIQGIEEIKHDLGKRMGQERAAFKQKNKDMYDAVDLAVKQHRRLPRNTLSNDWIKEKHALAGRVDGMAALIDSVNELVVKHQTYAEAAYFQNLAPKHLHGHSEEYHLSAAFRCLRRSKYQAVEVLLRALDGIPVDSRSPGQAEFLRIAQDIEMKKTAQSELSQILKRSRTIHKDLQLADRNDLARVVPLKP